MADRTVVPRTDARIVISLQEPLLQAFSAALNCGVPIGRWAAGKIGPVPVVFGGGRFTPCARMQAAKRPSASFIAGLSGARAWAFGALGVDLAELDAGATAFARTGLSFAVQAREAAR